MVDLCSRFAIAARWWGGQIEATRRRRGTGPGSAVVRNAQVQGDAALGFEPTLDELLAEPIVQLLMRTDGVSEGEIRLMAGRLRLGDAIRLARASRPA